MELVRCENLNVFYGGVQAVCDISFSIYSGDYISIVGKNGSGKSTLLKSLLGLKRQKKGRVIYNVKKKHIGYMPQKNIIKTDFPASVEEVVTSGLVNSLGFCVFFDKKQREKLKYILDALGLNDIKSSPFKDLSKGQQQRVLFARAVTACESILFLDEPCSGLDPLVTKEFYYITKNLNAQKNIAIVMISHDINSAILNSKKILHMQNRSLFFGSTSEYVKSEFFNMFLKGE